MSVHESTLSAVLGFPRIGANRELKKATERFWSGKMSEEDLVRVGTELRLAHWRLQKEQGVDVIPSNDFSFYDVMLDHCQSFGLVPERYHGLGLNELETLSAMGRGLQRPATDDKPAVDVRSMEMVKWFDSNYHYFRPEVGPECKIALQEPVKAVEEFKEAKAAGIATRPVLIGPVTFLKLAKPTHAAGGVEPLESLERLVDCYVELLERLVAAGAQWVQVDEPVLVLDLSTAEKEAFRKAYARVGAVAGAKVMLTTYFGAIGDNWEVVRSLPVAGLHLDLVRGPDQLKDSSVLDHCTAQGMSLSLGLVSGRDVWKTDLRAAVAKAREAAVGRLGAGKVQVATSSSLLHIPFSLEPERKMDETIKSWFSFAVEKCGELRTIAQAINKGPESVAQDLEENARCLASRRDSPLTTNPAVRAKLAALKEGDFRRASPFPERQKLQRAALQLPELPTTTIGSFPQTKEIRLARSRFNKGELSADEYEGFIKREIENNIRLQAEVGLDVFVHGEPERNDMVQYFGERLQGFAFTENGWVQSYGSRCVRPPIIVGDVSRPEAMTVKESVYAQSLTKVPVKGMLTGPITMLRWSFRRDDIDERMQAEQLGLALREEVCDLEAAGITLVQVDEPALREGLPLRRSEWDAYLKWAVGSFRLATSGVKDSTSCHSHFCYSDFQDIMQAIMELDADVISIENSKSDLKLLDSDLIASYPNEIGPGVYDIHSPRVPSQAEMVERLRAILGRVSKGALWVNPDCGLKTRGWEETLASLKNMVAAARQLRASA